MAISQFLLLNAIRFNRAAANGVITFREEYNDSLKNSGRRQRKISVRMAGIIISPLRGSAAENSDSLL